MRKCWRNSDASIIGNNKSTAYEYGMLGATSERSMFFPYVHSHVKDFTTKMGTTRFVYKLSTHSPMGNGDCCSEITGGRQNLQIARILMRKLPHYNIATYQHINIYDIFKRKLSSNKRKSHPLHDYLPSLTFSHSLLCSSLKRRKILKNIL